MQPVLPVGVSEERHQVVFFKLNGQEYVARRRNRKYEVAVSHLGRGPEGEKESEVDRVANLLVEHWRLESNRLIGLTAQVKCDLPQTKEVSMANHHCARQNGEPSKTEKSDKSPVASGTLNVPHSFRHGSPLPKQQVQAEAGEQDIRAPLNWVGNELRPCALEPLARHHTVLDSEEA